MTAFNNFFIFKYLRKFLRKFNPKSNHPGFISQTFGEDDFEKKFRIALTNRVLQNNIDTRLPCNLTNNGYKQLFTAETNELRNSSKRKAITNSKRLYLLSKTGNSFIGATGNRYFTLIENNISQFGSSADIKILLLNPWTVSAVMTALTESDAYEEFKLFEKKELPSQQIIEAFKQTKWYNQKLNDVIQNYKNIKAKYPQIKLRFIDYELSASILITDTSMFYESYSNFVKNDRLLNRISSFEAEIDDTNPFYKEAIINFTTLWDYSDSYDDIINNAGLYINRLSAALDLRYHNNTSFYIGAHVLIRDKNKFLLLHRTKTKAYMPGEWDIPGGGLEQGEDLEETAKREVNEETGLNIYPRKILFAYSNKKELPLRQTVQVIYEAPYNGGDVIINPSEHDEYRWVTKDELLDLPVMDFLRNFVINNYDQLS